MKKKVLVLLPLLALSFSACSQNDTSTSQDPNASNSASSSGEGQGSIVSSGSVISEGSVSVISGTSNDSITSQNGDSNEELSKFNELVSKIKNGHNYTLEVHSQMLECDDDEILDCKYFAINNKAWVTDYSYYTYSGYVYQKDQGYVWFDDLAGAVVTDGFVSTNKDAFISDLMEVIGENLFINEYSQSSTDKKLFSSIGDDNIAVAAYFTQYYPYITSGQLQVDSSINATLDVSSESITLNLKYWMHYFDEVEHRDESYITIKVKDIGSTSISEIESYIENPLDQYVAPTAWSSDDLTLFETYSPEVVPPFINGASYAFTFVDDLYDGYYYAIATDKASGNLSSSYGAQLVEAGYTKVNDTKYTKLVTNPETLLGITYQVLFQYQEATVAYPKGVFKVLYKAFTTTGTFSTIEAFNNYLSTMKYDELIPTLPEESTCTKIENFKDQTATSEGYALAFNKTDFFKVYIADFSKAQAFISSYVSAMADKGYTDKNVSPFGYSTYWYENSSTGTYITIVDSFTSSTYKGYVELNARVTSDDADELRTIGATLESISISGYSTQYEVGSTFSFNGTCKATYSNGASKNVTPTNVSSPDMSTEGTKHITVTYTEGEVTKTQSYDIEVVNNKQLSKIELSGWCSRLFKKDGSFSHMGLCVTATYTDGSTAVVSNDATYSGYDLSTLGEQTVTVSYKYKEVTKTASYTICVKSALTFPTISLSCDTGIGAFANDSYEEETTLFNYNEADYFYVFAYPTAEGYSPSTLTVVGDSDAVVTLDSNNEYVAYGYTVYIVKPSINFDATSINIQIAATYTPVSTTSYNVSKQSGLTGGKVVLVSPSTSTDVEVGETVKFKASPNEGYEVEQVFVVDHPEIEISSSQGPMQTMPTYSFTMPAHACVISASFKAIATSKALQSISLSGTYATEFEVGDTFSSTGLVVTAHYDDSTSSTVTPTSVSSPDMSSAGTKVVTVTYTEGEVTKTETYQITVSAKQESGEFTSGTFKYTTTTEIDLILTFNANKTGSYNVSNNVISFTWSVSGKTITIVPETGYNEDNFGSNRIFFGETSCTATLGTDNSTLTVKVGNVFTKKDKTFNIVA